MKRIDKDSIFSIVLGTLLTVTIFNICNPFQVTANSDYSNKEITTTSEVHINKILEETTTESSSEDIIEEFLEIETLSEETTTNPPKVSEEETEESFEFDYIPLSDDLKRHVREMCEFYNFEEELIYQIIYVESKFNPDASSGLCNGLMQVSPVYSDHYADIDDGCPYEISSDNYDIYDPYDNIVLGLRCLSDWRSMGTNKGYSDISDWLSFYNMGWGYMSYGPNGYAEKVLSTDLSSIDFSTYKIVE